MGASLGGGGEPVEAHPAVPRLTRPPPPLTEHTPSYGASLGSFTP